MGAPILTAETAGRIAQAYYEIDRAKARCESLSTEIAEAENSLAHWLEELNAAQAAARAELRPKEPQ